MKNNVQFTICIVIFLLALFVEEGICGGGGRGGGGRGSSGRGWGSRGGSRGSRGRGYSGSGLSGGDYEGLSVGTILGIFFGSGVGAVVLCILICLCIIKCSVRSSKSKRKPNVVNSRSATGRDNKQLSRKGLSNTTADNKPAPPPYSEYSYILERPHLGHTLQLKTPIYDSVEKNVNKCTMKYTQEDHNHEAQPARDTQIRRNEKQVTTKQMQYVKLPEKTENFSRGTALERSQSRDKKDARGAERPKMHTNA